jgi:hypothetical protein
MPRRAEDPFRVYWPCHFGCCHHPFTLYGPPPTWGPPRWSARLSQEEEKQALGDHIVALKEELAEAERELKELERKEETR